MSMKGAFLIWNVDDGSNLNTDALHHVQLASAVEVQNGLKLAGGPGHDGG